jgi:hypothetical protein
VRESQGPRSAQRLAFGQRSDGKTGVEQATEAGVLPHISGRVSCAQHPYLTQERLAQGRKNLLRLGVSENLSRKSHLGASENVGCKSVMLGRGWPGN